MEQQLEIFNRDSCPESDQTFCGSFFLSKKKDRVMMLRDPDLKLNNSFSNGFHNCFRTIFCIHFLHDCGNVVTNGIFA